MNQTALYRFFATDDTLLYVGITASPKSRFKDHARDKPWWPDVARATVEWFSDWPSARAAELAAIAAELPVHNRAGHPNFSMKREIPEGCISIADARNKLSELISKARYLGVSTVLVRNGRRVAALVPVEVAERYEAELAARESAAD